MPETSPAHNHVLFSTLGWIFAALFVLVFFVFAKPYYQRRAALLGQQDTLAADRLQVDQAFGQVVPPGSTSALQVRVIRVDGNSIYAQQQPSSLLNPLDPQPQTQQVLIDTKTVIVRRTQLTQEQYNARAHTAQGATANPASLAPYDDAPLALADILPGYQLQILPRDPQAKDAPSFMADEVALFVYPTEAVQASPNP